MKILNHPAYNNEQKLLCIFDPRSWETSEWSPCSTSCDRGHQTRTVDCKQRISDAIQISIVSDSCRAEPLPDSVQICNEDNPCVKWRVGEWSKVGGGRDKTSYITGNDLNILHASNIAHNVA